MRFCRTTLDGRLHQKHPVNSLFRPDQAENQGTPFDVLMKDPSVPGPENSGGDDARSTTFIIRKLPTVTDALGESRSSYGAQVWAEQSSSNDRHRVLGSEREGPDTAAGFSAPTAAAGHVRLDSAQVR